MPEGVMDAAPQIIAARFQMALISFQTENAQRMPIADTLRKITSFHIGVIANDDRDPDTAAGVSAHAVAHALAQANGAERFVWIWINQPAFDGNAVALNA